MLETVSQKKVLGRLATSDPCTKALKITEAAEPLLLGLLDHESFGRCCKELPLHLLP